jgi:AraC family transcriptional activator of tynA and feaB
VPDRSPTTFEEVDSRTLPASERFALWRETGRLPMAADPPDDDARRLFRIRVRKLSGAPGRFTDMAMTPMKLVRQARHIAGDGLDMISLTLLLGADIRHQLGGADRSAAVRPGQILVKDFARPATAWWKTSSRSLNIHLPRPIVQGAIGNRVGRLHGKVLAGEGLVPLLATQMRTLARIAPRLKSPAHAAALAATAELAASVLRCELGVPIEDEANRAGLFAAAQACIRRHLASSELNPDFVARQIGCSRAHLYRAFAARGETVAGCVRELRLQRAYEILTGEAAGRARIGDLAYLCGFEDPVHFTRLFRTRFGLTPSALKAGEGRSGK